MHIDFGNILTLLALFPLFAGILLLAVWIGARIVLTAKGFEGSIMGTGLVRGGGAGQVQGEDEYMQPVAEEDSPELKDIDRVMRQREQTTSKFLNQLKEDLL
jgi:hypothetical protein